MNSVNLLGRLTAKPELRYTSTNLAMCRFTIAVNRTYSNSQGEKETDYINCVSFKKQAENICNFLDKGSLVAIEGRIQTGSYDDKDGNKRYTTDVMVNGIQFLSASKKEEKAEQKEVKQDVDPFAEFGEQVSIDDNYLD